MPTEKRIVVALVTGLALPLGGCLTASNGLRYPADNSPGETPATASMGVPPPGQSGYPSGQLPIPGEPYGYAVLPTAPKPPPPAPVVAPPPVPPPCEASGATVKLAGCKQGDVIVLRGVNFEFNQATLTLNAKALLDNVATALNEHPEIKIEIDGHTDSKGSDSYNLRLSRRRAASVRQYLIHQGIAADRMTSAGFGETRPIADNATDDGRAMNRRVELKITEAAMAMPMTSPSAPPATAASSDAAPMAAGTGNAVRIVHYSFTPADLAVTVGTVVTWTNDDDATHIVKFGDQQSGPLTRGSSFRRAFTAPGIYPYQCGIHSYMKGRVIVR